VSEEATFAAILAIVKDLVVTLAAAGGLIVALLGLRTWKRQLKGKTEWDLARRYLRGSTSYGMPLAQFAFHS